MKIYLAIPYSHPSAKVREQRFKLANKYAARYMNQGNIVFSPISHSHTIATQETLPAEWEFWKIQDRAFIEWCDAIVVVKADGWRESVGVQAEIEIAKKLGKTVFYQNGTFT